MEVQKEGPSGQQQPVGTEHRVEEIAQFFLALPFEDQRDLLVRASAQIVPRLTDLSREAFIDQLRNVPVNDGKFDTYAAEQDHPESEDEVFEDWMRQAVGAQKHILLLVAPRVLTNFQGPERDRYLFILNQAIIGADAGELNPTLH